MHSMIGMIGMSHLLLCAFVGRGFCVFPRLILADHVLVGVLVGAHCAALCGDLNYFSYTRIDLLQLEFWQWQCEIGLAIATPKICPNSNESHSGTTAHKHTASQPGKRIDGVYARAFWFAGAPFPQRLLGELALVLHRPRVNAHRAVRCWIGISYCSSCGEVIQFVLSEFWHW